jgi:hypothetical protein
MLLVPPQHGKSELASRRFPAYYLGRHPERKFISASAGVTLAEDFGRDVRNIIASPEYAYLFDTRLAEDSQAKGRWNTAQGGSYFAVGVNSQVMGRGAHVFMIDDPFGTMADARSEVERKNVWDSTQKRSPRRFQRRRCVNSRRGNGNRRALHRKQRGGVGRPFCFLVGEALASAQSSLPEK